MTLEVDDLVAWAKAFAFTQIVEAPIYRFVVPTRWTIALAASAITHPFVWFAFPPLGAAFGWGWTLTSIVSEIFAVTVEAVLVRQASRVGWRRAFGVSLLANCTSVAIGLAVRHTTGLI
jgi:hypothetical protein